MNIVVITHYQSSYIVYEILFLKQYRMIIFLCIFAHPPCYNNLTIKNHHQERSLFPMRYAESYTTFLKYCASRFNQPIEKLIPAFQQNTIEDKFLKLYHSSNRELSSESYYELLEVAKSGIRTRKKSDDTSDNTIYLRLSIMIELL